MQKNDEVVEEPAGAAVTENKEDKQSTSTSNLVEQMSSSSPNKVKISVRVSPSEVNLGLLGSLVKVYRGVMTRQMVLGVNYSGEKTTWGIPI